MRVDIRAFEGGPEASMLNEIFQIYIDSSGFLQLEISSCLERINVALLEYNTKFFESIATLLWKIV